MKVQQKYLFCLIKPALLIFRITKAIKIAKMAILRKAREFCQYFEISGCAKVHFEFGAKKLSSAKSQSNNSDQTKTKTADKSATFCRDQKFVRTEMEMIERNQKIIKELLFFNFDNEEFDWFDCNKNDEEAAKIETIFASISKINIGRAGYDVKKNDVIKARQVHIWSEPTPHGPIVIEFIDSVVNLVKNALEKAGEKIDFKFGAFLCEISCQSSVGNRWPRLRYRLMERLRCQQTETSAISKKKIAEATSAEHPFPQYKIENKAVNMSSQRRRIARANSSNPRALRVIDIDTSDPDPVQVLSDTDVQTPIQAPVVSSSTLPTTSNSRRQRLIRYMRNTRRGAMRGSRQVHLESIARSNSTRARVREADSTSSSDSSVTFISSFMSEGISGASTSTPNPAPQAGQNGTTENVVIDLTVSSDDHSPAEQSDYHTAPETPEQNQVAQFVQSVQNAQTVQNVQIDEPFSEEDEDGDQDIPNLSDIEMEMAREAEARNAAYAAADAAIADAKIAVEAAGAARAGGRVFEAVAGGSGTAAGAAGAGAVVAGAVGAGAAGAETGEEAAAAAASTDGDGNGTDTDYLASVSPRKIPKNPIALPLMLENDVITLEDSSETSSDSGSEGWVDRSPSSTSTDDERHLEISRQEVRDLEEQRQMRLEIERRIYEAGETPSTSDEEDGNVPGPNGPTQPGMPRPDRDHNNDRRVNFLLLQSTVVIDDGIVDGEDMQTNRISYHQRTLAKELLITLLERMVHIDNDLFAVFSDPNNRKKAGNRTPIGLAGDENWPRGLTISELIVAYENGYDWVRRQEDAEYLIERYGMYHPSVFHTTGTRRVYVGPCYNRTPPLGTPMDTFNTFRELQPIPARSSPSIVIPVTPVYVPETPEQRQHFRPEKKSTPEPEVNAIPADVSLQFENNCGFLNNDLERKHSACADWAHAVLDAEEALKIPAHLLPDNPFINPREPKTPVSYRRSIRNLFVRLVLRLDSINEAKFARSNFSMENAPWYNDDSRRENLMNLLNNYDKVVDEVKRITDQMEATKASKVAEAESTVLEGLEDLHLTTEAAKAEAGKIKTENLKPSRKVRHYFTRCESGAIEVNYEFVGYQDALFAEAELNHFERLTQNGACTAQECECPGNPSSSYDLQISGIDRLANLSGRTLSQFVPSREPTMPNGFRPLRQIRPTPMRPPRPVRVVSPPEPEVPRSLARNSATYVVEPAGMSDSDNDDVFDIQRIVPEVPTPARNPRPNEEYWYNCNIDSE